MIRTNKVIKKLLAQLLFFKQEGEDEPSGKYLKDSQIEIIDWLAIL